MRTAVRLTLLCVSLAILICDGRAQPSQQPDIRARCKAAANKFTSVVSDKKHRTVEHQSQVTYNEGKKYLNICGGLDDNFTRSIKESVANNEGARRCEVETWPRYSARVDVNYTDAPARRREAYEAAKEYLRLCGRYDLQSAYYTARQAKRYEAALSPPKANATAAPCDEQTMGGIYEHFLRNYKGGPAQQKEAFVTGKEYLCRCADFDDKITLFVKSWLHKFESRQEVNGASALPAPLWDAPPRCRCDVMRDELSKLTIKGLSEYGGEHGKDIYETVGKFLRVCGDRREKIDLFFFDWVEKYDKAVREFEEKRKAEGSPAKGPTRKQ